MLQRFEFIGKIQIKTWSDGVYTLELLNEYAGPHECPYFGIQLFFRHVDVACKPRHGKPAVYHKLQYYEPLIRFYLIEYIMRRQNELTHIDGLSGNALYS